MKTKIIIKKGWKIIAKYDFLITLSKGDYISIKDVFEYRVDCCLLDLSDNVMQILVE